MKVICRVMLICTATVNSVSAGNPILSSDFDLQILAPGHYSVLRLPRMDDYYIVYHAHKGDKDRRVFVDKLSFDADGTLAQVKPMRTGVAPVSLAKHSLMRYRADLEAFCCEYGGAREMPDVPFFQFGMGPRAKYLFKNGVLTRAPNGPVIRLWDARESSPKTSVLFGAAMTSGG